VTLRGDSTHLSGIKPPNKRSPLPNVSDGLPAPVKNNGSAAYWQFYLTLPLTKWDQSGEIPLPPSSTNQPPYLGFPALQVKDISDSAPITAYGERITRDFPSV
jgi:hypothetical protein